MMIIIINDDDDDDDIYDDMLYLCALFLLGLWGLFWGIILYVRRSHIPQGSREQNPAV